MKKMLALLLAAMMLMCCIPAMAEELPEGYPEVKEGIDFGGATLYIRPYWGPSPRSAEPTEQQQAEYDYKDWIMKTYNVNVVEEQVTDWTNCAEEFINFCTVNNGEYAIYVIEPGKVGSLVANNLCAPWNNDLVDLTAEKWNKGDLEFMTKGGNVYGVYTGPTEPRQMLYFNKRILEEANIDPESIYDLQKEDKWTWDALLDMLAQITKDTDNDGIIDVWGMTGNFTDLNLIAVFSNGGSFFDYDENGKLVPTMNSDAALEAFTYAKTIYDSYFSQPAEGAAWDYFIQDFKDGNAGFLMHQGYSGFKSQDTNTELKDMEDEWGAVAFPTPKGGNYVTIASDNFWIIPNVYDAETTAKIAYIYDLWTNDVPGYEDAEENWQGMMYSETDDRAVDETYAYLRHAAATNKALLLPGGINPVLGQPLLWNLSWRAAAECIEESMPAWQALCDDFNSK